MGATSGKVGEVLEIGITGLPQSGKTAIFNALTRSKAETRGVSGPNIGVAKVSDLRLQELAKIFQPKKVIPIEVKYVDVAAFPGGFGKGEGISGQLQSHLSKADALLHVVRAFQDESVPHVEGSIDPERDISTLDLELAFSDLAILEKRLERISVSLKGARSPEREQLLRERSILKRIKNSLENETPVREQELLSEEKKLASNYQFLTAKPLLVVVNIGEEQLGEAEALKAKLRTSLSCPKRQIVLLCGKLEAELAQLDEDEALEFRKALGIAEPAVDKITRYSYELLELITFFTVVSGEVKAWTIPRETTALKAAGKIHSDMERGFIRAEVIGYSDLVRCGSLAEGRKQGVLRLEGKESIIQDGDIVTFLFNV